MTGIWVPPIIGENRLIPETGPKTPIRIAAQECPDLSAVFCEEVAEDSVYRRLAWLDRSFC